MTTPTKNPGLADFELTGYQGIRGSDFYELNSNLRNFLKQNIPADEFAKVEEHLHKVGALAGNELDELAELSHKEGKYGKLVKFDRHGKKVDDIEYCAEQKEIRRLCYEAGVVNLDCHEDWQQPFRYLHREAAAYLLNLNGEMGVTCPLAMTEGTIEILREIGTDKQKKKWLPVLTDPDSKSYFMAGQYLTERVGGSNVGANRTVAKPVDGDEQGPGSKWLLTGEKWFCSNPGDVWLTTAKIEGSDTIGVFVVGRYKDNGELNGHDIMRLKDIIGSRGKVTAEVAYDNVEAELVGRKSVGLAYLIKHVITISRIHTALGAVAGARRAVWEARAYSENRMAFGKKIGRFQATKRMLAVMQAKASALELAVFLNWKLKDDESPLTAVLSPLMKYIGTSHAERIVHDSIILHGGNGIIGDYSILPRLRNDAIINETWEGAHQIIALHTVKAAGRDKNRKAYFALIEDTLGRISDSKETVFQKAAGIIRDRTDFLKTIEPKSLTETNAIAFAEKLYEPVSLTVLINAALDFGDGEAGKYKSMLAVLCETYENGAFNLVPADSILEDEKSCDAVIAAS